MAASSSEAYDVFLSFRGEDTRQILISHLYAALREKGIRVFLDDEGIKRGDELSPTLLGAIERSRISIITFSEDYASSPWCLDELAKIIECREIRGQIVLPIFYNVPPSHVRNQRGKYQTAFVEHEKYSQSKVQKWRAALSEAASLGGWDSAKKRSDFELVTVVVEDVLQKLNYIMEPLVPSGFVGIDRRISQVESSLCNDRSNDVCIVGIYGMAGVGKTALAETLFQKHFSQFEGHCFLSDVREKWTARGRNALRNELLTQILGDQIPNINSNLVVNRLRQKKILAVLDDVSDPQQLEYLIGKKEWYGPGSKIIVTTRDKSLLQNDFDGEYGVMPLDDDEAHKLFCLSAFKQDQPKSEFIDLTDMAVDYAGGNPLALKVLGSHLQSKNTREWESALKKLKKVPNPDIYSVLRWSYEELDYEAQQIFLEIACFLKGEKKLDIISLLDSYGFSGEIGMRVLQDKSLITLEKDQTIRMHDLVQEMGRHIVREESIKRPEARSRLWDPEEVYHILKANTGTDAIEGIKLDMSRVRDLSLGPPQAFARMTRLKVLNFYLPEGEKTCKVHIPEGIEVLSTELRCFHWNGFPRKALPASFFPKNLVKLDLRNSLLEKLWDGEKDCANLKSINLSGCKRLVELPDLSKAVNLEELNLGSCTSLREVPSYVSLLDHLLALNLEGCTQLQCCRSDMHLNSLRWLNLSGCSNLVEFSLTSDKLEFLSLKDTGIEELSPSVWQNKNLSYLDLSGCRRLKKLPPIVGTLSIKSLSLNGCSNLSELPDNLNLLVALYTLSVQGSCIETLPASIKDLSQLRSLDVSHCKRLRSLPELPLLLHHLNAKGCTCLETVSSSAACKLRQNFFGCQNWKSLLKQHQELKVSLRHFHLSDRFEFDHCRRLNENARNSILIEAITRIKYAAHLSSLAQTYEDPYNQFQLFSKGFDAETLEFTCHQLCLRPLGGNIPDWFWLREIESSPMIIKLNANCCSHCKRSSFAFGLFRTNKEEDPYLRFSGRHRICVKQLVESPLWSFEKLWYNDVRVCLPGYKVPREFRHGRRDQTSVSIQLPRSSDLLGFAVCVISSHYPLTDNGCSPMIRYEWYLGDIECTRGYNSDSSYPHESEWELISDSVFLWFDEKTSNSILEAIKESRDVDQSTTHNPRLSFKFYCKSGIEDCGVWPIYASDLESQMLAPKRSRPCPGSDEQQFSIERNPLNKLRAVHRTMELNREIRRPRLIWNWRLQLVNRRMKVRTPSSSNKQKQVPPRKKCKRSLHIEELARITKAIENHDELQRLRQTKKLKKRSQQIPDAMCIFLKALNLFLITYPVSTGIAFH